MPTLSRKNGTGIWCCREPSTSQSIKNSVKVSYLNFLPVLPSVTYNAPPHPSMANGLDLTNSTASRPVISLAYIFNWHLPIYYFRQLLNRRLLGTSLFTLHSSQLHCLSTRAGHIRALEAHAFR